VQEIRAITLDLDDTLWAIGPVIARAEASLRAWFEANYPRVTERFSHESIVALRNELFAEHQERAHDLTFLRRALIARLGAASGYDDLPVDEAFAVFEAARNDLELFPDVRPALNLLKERYKLVAVTNGNANLERIGIRDLFDDVVCARTVGVAKPAQQIFEAAVAAGGALASHTLHVGDHPHIDVDGARRAGLKTVWINRVSAVWPEELPEPDGVVADLRQLSHVLSLSQSGRED
jgi:putative hydrolase of the HAD superfamily